jgi:transketolase N-terminal domain/subunit
VTDVTAPSPRAHRDPADAALAQSAVNVVRGLAMDAPRAANSGHPGTAMALAPLATVLHTRVLKHDPSDPHWVDRDRFVLSAGHASILLYSALHLSGYGLTLDDLRAFRQFGSPTPGHPEVHHTAGVEVTTGPLGQGFANAVGMAVAERFLRARFGSDVMDHHTYVVVGDGCLQEGVSHEAASLAGHLGLGRLIAVYDDNHITIDGKTELSFTDDTARRFEAYGWHVEHLGEIANDLDALESALLAAKARGDEGKPQLLVLRSHIGYPSEKYTDTPFAHGNPFPPEEIAAVKSAHGHTAGRVVLGARRGAVVVAQPGGSARHGPRRLAAAGRCVERSQPRGPCGLGRLLALGRRGGMGRRPAHLAPRREGGHPRRHPFVRACVLRRRAGPHRRRRGPHRERGPGPPGRAAAVGWSTRRDGSSTTACGSTAWVQP